MHFNVSFSSSDKRNVLLNEYRIGQREKTSILHARAHTHTHARTFFFSGFRQVQATQTRFTETTAKLSGRHASQTPDYVLPWHPYLPATVSSPPHLTSPHLTCYCDMMQAAYKQMLQKNIQCNLTSKSITLLFPTWQKSLQRTRGR